MARKPRITTRGLTHHVYSRCIENRKLLLESFAPALLEEIIYASQEKYSFQMAGYQIMDTHFHFVITTVKEGESISKIMQYIKSRFAREYNRRTDRTGPFWNERFKDVVVESADNPPGYLLWLLWYLAYNPVRKKMGTDPRAFRYGSINCYLDEKYQSAVKITLHSFFIDLGATFGERLEAFLMYEKAYRNRWAVMF